MSAASGFTTHEPETLLVERAADFLAAGPADARTLVARVCQLPGVPAAVAEHMAATLLAPHRRFLRTDDGRWILRDQLQAQLALELGAEVVAPPPPSASIDVDALRALSYAVVDVETTGGRPDRGDRITEIAAVVVREGQIAERFESLVNPERPIPPFITGLTNISWEMVKDAPRFADLCEPLLATLEGHVFVAHNATFDWRFVAAEVRRATGRELGGRRLCTVKLARKLLPQLRRRSLDHVTAHYGIEIEARHRAMGDAYATAQALLRMIGDAESRGCACWSDLEKLLGASAPRRSRKRRPALPHPVSRDTTA